MKDIPDFTKLLLEKLPILNDNVSNKSNDLTEKKYSGIVKKVMINRFGTYCGYIKDYSNEIFFHSFRNPHLDFSNLEGKKVTYTKSTLDAKSRIQALNVIIEE